ncbi:MAG TPA: hypothetical protein VFI40_06715 [Nocardioides sp.]|nr:hypothetical protein [Nocardioides sp.]
MRRTLLVVLAALAVLALVVVGLALTSSHESLPRDPPRAGVKDRLDPTYPWANHFSTLRSPSLTTDEASRLTSTRWWLRGVDGRDLWIQYEIGSSSCDTDQGVFVRETAHRVLLGHYVRDTSNGNACTADMSMGEGVVHLDRPLGRRSLWHVVVDLDP